MLARLVPALFVLALCAGAAAQPPKAKPKFTNRLARETSPYLLMHAHNPTDWHAWGPEAFAKAKKENKLVFLSIGYSSCYWCHVMERESFNNEACAKLLNESYICIKVDREERPDIDHIYMTALHASRPGGGGWPLSMFLLPDGRPIVGGTYWPREDKMVDGEKMLGFMSLLRIVRDHWKEDPKAIEQQAEKLAEATAQALSTGPGIAIVGLDRKFVDGIVDELKDEFDPEYGGFGNPNRKFRGPKFPTPPRLELALQVAQRTKNKELLNMVTLTLDKMAHGGIWDHLGGGFHRYTVERTWTVPHFEKMLYDNAQLTELYSKAYAATGKPLYRQVVEDTLAYVRREMMTPEGAFYSSQDAETHHEEGRFYVWTPEELAAALPDKADRDFVRKVYGLDKVNFEDKYHILTLPKPLAEVAKEMKLTDEQLSARLNPLREKLFVERAKRDKPFRNEIALTAWSGQMIAGFAEAGRSLGDKQHLDVARKAAGFVLKHQITPQGRLLRTYGAAPGQQPKAAVNGYLEDYAFLVHGLLTLHETTGEAQWLEASKKLTDVMIQFHGDKKGGFYMTASDHEKLFARAKDQFDGAQPSGNSMAARNLARLWKLTGDEKWRDEAHRTFRVFAGGMKLNGTGLTTMAQALDGWLDVKELRKQ
ncbi:MAG: thioredoxin domain-containing protein [Gemmataceae bacterium]|nr:thioredoxin domain-containing protein [Gemmataceae bacterium]